MGCKIPSDGTTGNKKCSCIALQFVLPAALMTKSGKAYAFHDTWGCGGGPTELSEGDEPPPSEGGDKPQENTVASRGEARLEWDEEGSDPCRCVFTGQVPFATGTPGEGNIGVCADITLINASNEVLHCTVSLSAGGSDFLFTGAVPVKTKKIPYYWEFDEAFGPEQSYPCVPDGGGDPKDADAGSTYTSYPDENADIILTESAGGKAGANLFVYFSTNTDICKYSITTITYSSDTGDRWPYALSCGCCGNSPDSNGYMEECSCPDVFEEKWPWAAEPPDEYRRVFDKDYNEINLYPELHRYRQPYLNSSYFQDAIGICAIDVADGWHHTDARNMGIEREWWSIVPAPGWSTSKDECPPYGWFTLVMPAGCDAEDPCTQLWYYNKEYTDQTYYELSEDKKPYLRWVPPCDLLGGNDLFYTRAGNLPWQSSDVRDVIAKAGNYPSVGDTGLILTELGTPPSDITKSCGDDMVPVPDKKTHVGLSFDMRAPSPVVLEDYNWMEIGSVTLTTSHVNVWWDTCTNCGYSPLMLDQTTMLQQWGAATYRLTAIEGAFQNSRNHKWNSTEAGDIADYNPSITAVLASSPPGELGGYYHAPYNWGGDKLCGAWFNCSSADCCIIYGGGANYASGHSWSEAGYDTKEEAEAAQAMSTSDRIIFTWDGTSVMPFAYRAAGPTHNSQDAITWMEAGSITFKLEIYC